MYDFLSDLTLPLLTPIGLAMLVWLVGLGLGLRGYRFVRKCCTIGGILLLLAFASPEVGGAFLATLEDDYPVTTAADCADADAIVILGGVTAPPMPPRATIDVGAGFDRLLHGMRLFRLGKAPVLLLSGGAAMEQAGIQITEAARLFRLSIEYGIDPSAIWLEERSENTHENARFSSEMLRNKGLSKVLLVTSASHMPRAAAAFKKEGLDTVAAPTDMRAIGEPDAMRSLVPSLRGLEYSTIAMREYCGLVVYWVRGWI